MIQVGGSLGMAMRGPRHLPLASTMVRAQAAASCLFVLLMVELSARAQPAVSIDSCYDGDTCRTTTGEKIRIACIDAPELQGPRAAQLPAEAARDYLRQLVVGQEVLIRRIGQDRYGRAIAEIYLWPFNIGEEMVASGHARILHQYSSHCPWALL